MTQVGRAAQEPPVVIDLRDRASADLRSVCLRALHELATSYPLSEQVAPRTAAGL